jgi:WhiB family redox-sensing transcriptional regulator
MTTTFEFVRALLEESSADGAWRRDAACAAAARSGGMSVNDWFPERGDCVAVRRALAVCAECPVRVRCLEFALREGHLQAEGVWGGTTGRERRRLFRERKKGIAS